MGLDRISTKCYLILLFLGEKNINSFQKLSLQQKSDLILYQRLIIKLNFKYESRLFKHYLEELKERNDDYNFPPPHFFAYRILKKKPGVWLFN